MGSAGAWGPTVVGGLVASDFSWKDKVRIASASSVADLSSVTVADFDGSGQGITLVENDRVLVKDTASIDGVEGVFAKRNGLYVVGVVAAGSAPLTRSDDANLADELESAAVFVDEGSNADRAFVQTADNVILETTALTFVQFAGLGIEAVLTTDDKDLTPASTSGDGDDSTLDITNTPADGGFIEVLVNGVQQVLGDGVKTKDCYFSSDGGTTARAIAAITAADSLFWNGVIVGFDLAVDDRVDFNYDV